METSQGTGVVVVTGASGGVGRATAREFAARGWDVALLARGEAGLEAAAEQVRARGRRALPIPTDVADAEAVERAAQQVEDELGVIECWVNAAMTTVFATISDLEPEEVRRGTEVTYLGQVNGVLAALRRMRERDRGTIVFVGSALSYRGIPLQAVYCAAKFAVRGFYESLRTELLHEGSNVRATIVHLPAVNTTQFGWCRAKVDKHPQPVPPIYQPEVCAVAIADAADAAPRQKLLGTWNWLLVQVAQVMPGVGDHFMAKSGVGGQLTDIPIDRDRPNNLFEPVDADEDHGYHGIFDEKAKGVVTPSFLKQLPQQAKTFYEASRARIEEVRQRRAA
jgi:short-subunit dehydrogenase